MFNLACCDGRVRVWRTAREKYVPECPRTVNRNRIVSVMVWGHWLPRCWQSGHYRWKRECGLLYQNTVRKPSRFCRKHTWRQKSSIRVSTWQCSGPHGASNFCMVGAAGHIHHSMAIPVPGPWYNRTSFGILLAKRSLESCLSREMIWFERCTIPGRTSECHICKIFTTPFPEE